MLQKSQDRHKISFDFKFNNKKIKKASGQICPPPPETIKLDFSPDIIRVNMKCIYIKLPLCYHPVMILNMNISNSHRHSLFLTAFLSSDSLLVLSLKGAVAACGRSSAVCGRPPAANSRSPPTEGGYHRGQHQLRVQCCEET